MRKISSYLIFTLFFIAGAWGKTQYKLYVDPEKGNDVHSGTTPRNAVYSISKAQEIAENLCNEKEDRQITIYLRNGEHVLSDPIVVKNHGAKNKIRFTSYRNERPIVSGGYKISGWNIYNKEKNIYYALVPQKYLSRQLYINGLRATRARLTNTEKISFDEIGHVARNKDMLTWKSPEQIECVYREIWTNPRCLIQSISLRNDSSVQITMQQPGWGNCRTKGITQTRSPWYFENAFEFLDEEGEWFRQNRRSANSCDTIFYKPYPWQNMTHAHAIMPILDQLVVIAGENENNPVVNVAFDNITFMYTTWLRPSSHLGHSDAQNSVIRENFSGSGESCSDGAAINVRYAQNISITHCNFAHLGTIGIKISDGCRRGNIDHSVFYDLSATAIQMGEYNNWKENAIVKQENRSISHWDIHHNHIEQCGKEYRSSTGIAAVFPHDCQYTNNTLKNLPYSGFHIGWGWTTISESSASGLVFTKNKIQNVMIELADGGAFYTLGPSKKKSRNLFSENYINRVMWGQGVYLDNGTDNYLIQNNVMERVDDYNIKINSGSHDNSVTGVFSDKIKNMEGKSGCHNNHIDSTILIEKMNTEAHKIKKNAGTGLSFGSVWECIPDLKIYEAEYAEIDSALQTTSGIGTGVSGYRGMGYLTGFHKAKTNRAIFDINVSSTGTYKVTLRYSSTGNIEGEMQFASASSSDVIPLHLESCLDNEWKEVSFHITARKGVNRLIVSNKKQISSPLLLDCLYIYPEKQ